jgi:mRNA-degrading endonuclease toxin of MazEF toxin-antitoxin module
MDTARFPGTVVIDPSKSNGLTARSVALVFQLGACDVRRIGRKIGRLSKTDLHVIRDVALRIQKMA